jgi:hypothetical protein
MNKEFLELYKTWYYSYVFDSTGRCSMINDKLVELEMWCKKNKDEAIKSIIIMLEDEPDNVIILLPELTGIRPKWLNEATIGLYMTLEEMSNWWLNYLKNTKNIDYYKNWREWKKYLDKHYMSWRPNLENDPNVTQKQFKEGKRNSESNRSWHDFSLSILTDQELKKLYNDGHLGNMTKYIKELHFFYNTVEEEIKRRKLKNAK